MIPTEDKEAVISKFAHLRLPPHCMRQTNNPEGPKFVIADVGMCYIVLLVVLLITYQFYVCHTAKVLIYFVRSGLPSAGGVH